jgi:hypothetical protein
MCFSYRINFAVISLLTNGRKSSKILTYIANILQTFRCSELVDSPVTCLFQSLKILHVKDQWNDFLLPSLYSNSGTLALNPLNVELNPICHLLILLGDLTFMGTCIVSIFQYISNKMQGCTVYLYLETTLHVLGGTSTHHQERIQLYLQHLVFVTATHSTLKPVPTSPR